MSRIEKSEEAKAFIAQHGWGADEIRGFDSSVTLEGHVFAIARTYSRDGRVADGCAQHFMRFMVLAKQDAVEDLRVRAAAGERRPVAEWWEITGHQILESGHVFVLTKQRAEGELESKLHLPGGRPS